MSPHFCGLLKKILLLFQFPLDDLEHSISLCMYVCRFILNILFYYTLFEAN